MTSIAAWIARFVQALWGALGFRRGIVLAVMSYTASYADELIQAGVGTLPNWLIAEISAIPGWAFGFGLGITLLAVFLALRAMPKLQITFDPAPGSGCISNTFMADNTPAIFFRLRVENAGIRALVCTGHLIGVMKNGKQTDFSGNIRLTFAPGERPDAIAKELKSGVPHHLDVAYIVKSNTGVHLFPATEFNYDEQNRLRGRQFPTAITGLFQGPGIFRLDVLVASSDAPAQKIAIEINHTDDFKTVSAREVVA